MELDDEVDDGEEEESKVDDQDVVEVTAKNSRESIEKVVRDRIGPLMLELTEYYLIKL